MIDHTVDTSDDERHDDEGREASGAGTGEPETRSETGPETEETGPEAEAATDEAGGEGPGGDDQVSGPPEPETSSEEHPGEEPEGSPEPEAAPEPEIAPEAVVAPEPEASPAAAPPVRRSRSRRATRPTSAPTAEPLPTPDRAAPLDVFAEFGATGEGRDAAPAARDAVEPDALERIVFDGSVRTEEDADAGGEASVADATPDASVAEGDGPRLPVTTLLFQAPDISAARQRRRRAQAPAGPPVADEDEHALPETGPGTEPAGGQLPVPAVESARAESARAESTRAESTDVHEAGADDVVADDAGGGSDEDATSDQGGAAGTQPRRRRRRGGRGRRSRGTSGDGSTDDSTESESEAEDGEDDDAAEEADLGEEQEAGEPESEAGEDAGDEPGGASSRRRRRRRRGGRGGEPEDDGGSARPARADEVTALRGSTRLEAKRQRRREGRDAGRRRTIVTEAEFLARRESVDRAMVVRERDGRTQIAVLEDGVLVEHFVARRTQTSTVGNVYLGRVQNVLPSMEAAFVDLGKGRNAVLYAGEVNWDAAGMEGQPRRIEQALSAGDSVLVQVTKDPIGHKGARLTSQITLAGRYLVLVPSGGMTGISRKLPDTERSRLKRLLRDIVPDGAGVIVRTAAEGASEDELRRDVARLQAQWAEIQKRSGTASAPALLSSEPDLSIRVVRDVFNEDFGSVTIAGDEAWETISGYISSIAPDLTPRLHRWTGKDDVFAAHRIDEQLAKALDRKVWLPSGGSLVIDRTEAMIVIDVNTGKFTGTGGTLEETVTRNNLEAAEEIVRQLRLRDIGGIIVIDFIDMVLESNRDLVLRRLVECLGRDRTRHQVAEVTSLGLVQMTRKRVGQGLLEAFSDTCECCNGRGYVIHAEPVEKSGGGPVETQEDSARPGAASSRRRGRRGAEGGAAANQGGGRQAAARTAGEPDGPTLAAREAVKATLATIAAAAAHAHEEEPAHGETWPGAPEGGALREGAGETEEGDRMGEQDEQDVPEIGVIDFDVIRAAADVTAAQEPPEAEGPDEESPDVEGVEDDEAIGSLVESIDFDTERDTTSSAPPQD